MLDRLRQESAVVASAEAAQLGALRGAISELQTMLNGMGQQLQAEQSMRKSDAQVGTLRGGSVVQGCAWLADFDLK